MELNYKPITKKFGKLTIVWKINDTFLSNQQAKEEMTREIRKYFERNECKNTACQYFEISANAVLTGGIYN